MNTKEMIDLAARLLQISKEEAESYSHAVEGHGDLLYVSAPTKGGESIIVSDSGEVLYAQSCIGFPQHLDAFLNGTRTPLDAFNA